MSDMADLAQAQNERLDELRLRNCRLQGQATPEATGLCFNCGDPVADDRRWCSIECRDDWESLAARARMV